MQHHDRPPVRRRALCPLGALADGFARSSTVETGELAGPIRRVSKPRKQTTARVWTWWSSASTSPWSAGARPRRAKHVQDRMVWRDRFRPVGFQFSSMTCTLLSRWRKPPRRAAPARAHCQHAAAADDGAQVVRSDEPRTRVLECYAGLGQRGEHAPKRRAGCPRTDTARQRKRCAGLEGKRGLPRGASAGSRRETRVNGSNGFSLRAHGGRRWRRGGCNGCCHGRFITPRCEAARRRETAASRDEQGARGARRQGVMRRARSRPHALVASGAARRGAGGEPEPSTSRGLFFILFF